MCPKEWTTILRTGSNEQRKSRDDCTVQDLYGFDSDEISCFYQIEKVDSKTPTMLAANCLLQRCFVPEIKELTLLSQKKNYLYVNSDLTSMEQVESKLRRNFKEGKPWRRNLH